MDNKYEKYDPIVFRQLQNALNNNLSHSYLFNTNKNVFSYDLILNFAISILSINSNNSYDNIYKRVMDNCYEDLIIIDTNGNIIKKEEIDKVHTEMSRKSVEGFYRIYIIKNVDLLNLSSANSLLKFLEEPSDGVICLMLTENIDSVLSTIKSRCQIITFTSSKINDLLVYNNISANITNNKIMFYFDGNNNTNYDMYSNYADLSIEFLNYYRKNGIKSLTKVNKYVLKEFNEKNKMKVFLNILILFFNDILVYKTINKIYYFDDYLELIKEYSNSYTNEQIINKINVLVKKENNLKYNVNINLLLDSLIIEMEKV